MEKPYEPTDEMYKEVYKEDVVVFQQRVLEKGEFWLAVDEGAEIACAYAEAPEPRVIDSCRIWFTESETNDWIALVDDAVERIIGKPLSWQDEPVKVLLVEED